MTPLVSLTWLSIKIMLLILMTLQAAEIVVVAYQQF
jgi:hypothetical protein